VADAPFPLGRPARIAVLASGRGSNLSSLLAAFPPAGEALAAFPPSGGDALAAVRLVVSDRAGAAALARAAEAGVAAEHVPFGRDREGFERTTEALLERHAIDLICLAGFMRVLSAPFTERWHGRLLNVHPSLLPAFRGLAAPRQAIEAGVRASGCTVHFVDAVVDTGRTIVQRSVPVEEGDDEASLAARILAEEHVAYPEAVRLVLMGTARP
jgi:phosphoribosylglycinamide formyltransferase 1